jgi:cation transport ATPase
MNEQENITSQQANEALNSVNQSKSSVAESQKPPFLLAFIVSLSYACIVFGYGMAEHENEWALAMWVGAILFFLSTSFYFYSFRLIGIKVNIIPKSANSLKFNIVLAIILAIMVIAARELRLIGYEFAPHLFAFACGLILFISLRKYPTGEMLPKPTGAEPENSHDQH